MTEVSGFHAREKLSQLAFPFKRFRRDDSDARPRPSGVSGSRSLVGRAVVTWPSLEGSRSVETALRRRTGV
jgi:hypothetical protein